MAFLHMDLLKSVEHTARGSKYEILVFLVRETGERRIYVAKDGFGRGSVMTASAVDVADAKGTTVGDLVDSLIAVAKGDIDRNEFDDY
jgi:hypothetical protein